MQRRLLVVSCAALASCGASSNGPGSAADIRDASLSLDAGLPGQGLPGDAGASSVGNDSANEGSAAVQGDAVGAELSSALDGDGSGDALCSIVGVGTSGLVVSGTVLLPAGPTAGELFVNEVGQIACAAASCASSAGYGQATRIACPNAVISPSLVNAHDHTEYATRGPETLPTARFEHRNQWRVGTDGGAPLPVVEATTDEATLAAQELRFVLGGATSVIGSGGVAGLLRNLADGDHPAYLEGLGGSPVFFDTFPLGDADGTTRVSGCAYPKIRMASTAFSGGMYAPHLAEGIDLEAENELTCASATSNDLVTSRTAVIQGIGTTAHDVDAIARGGASLVWSPRSNTALYGDTAPVTVYKAMGVPIALGSDWLASGSMNMLRELACADSLNQAYFDHAFSDRDLFDMATRNGSIAAGFDAQIGTLEAGKFADVTIFDGRTRSGYRAVIDAGVEDVWLVLRAGKALYGDADLVAAFDSTCTPIAVCGRTKSVCVDAPSLALAQIEAAAAATYPLFFCRGTTPTDEPTCLPYRDTYPSGISAGDVDGDGVPDTSDDCPTVFNPPRLLDNGDGPLVKQADADGDGVGDACDAKPLDPTTH